jgi:hypothetical protein
MRHIAVFLMALVMIASLGSVAYANGVSATHTIYMDVDVLPSIQIFVGSWSWHVGDLDPGNCPPGLATINKDTGWHEVAFSNVPFTVTLTGSNDAGDFGPIFARQEVNTNPARAAHWDRLYTLLCFEYVTNGLFAFADDDRDDQSIVFESPGTYPPSGGYWWDRNSLNIPVPHDGDIWLQIYATVALPHITPDWGVDNEWWQSADAGKYSCYVTATYTETSL